MILQIKHLIHSILNQRCLIKASGCFICLILFISGEIRAHNRDTLSAERIEFIENRNQWPSQVLFKAPLSSGAFFAEKNRITYVFLNPKQLDDFHRVKKDMTQTHSGMIDASAYHVNFVGAREDVSVIGEDILSSYNNYYIGNDPSRWASEVHKYGTLRYRELYNGIDLLFAQHDHYFKYEFMVQPGANPNQITMEYEGVKGLSLSKGNLIVRTDNGQIIELKPFAFQLDNHGDTLVVECNYRLEKQKLSFSIETYDPTRILVIDPVLIFSSYSGSTADNWGYSATYDAHGNAYSGGNAFNIGYPTTTGAYQVNFGGASCDIAISKFDATGSFLHYSTYLGGSGTEIPHSLIVNSNDELIILGSTSSTDYPVTAGTYDTAFNGGSYYLLTSVLRYNSGSDIVLTKFNSTGTALLGSTYLGGTGNDGLNTIAALKKNYADEVRGEVMIDGDNNIYIVSSTQSVDFPVTTGVFQPQHNGGVQDACIVKMNHNLTNVIWSTYLGGSGDDAAYSMVLASDRSIFLCGGTNSLDFATSPGAIQTTYGGGVADGYVAHIHANGNQLVHASYIGKAGYDQAYLIKNDRYNNPHLFGQTETTGMSWVHNAGWFVPGGGQFLTKLTPTLDSLIWSTAFGRGLGGIDISPTALLVDLCNNIYMSGWGSPLLNAGQGGTAGLPITADAFQNTTDNNDYYFICISDDASSLVYASYFGSPNAFEHVDGGTSRFDNKGRIYQAVCAGCGGYDDFPTTPGAWSQNNGSTNCNIGVIKFDFNLPAVVADFNIPNTVCAPITVTFNNTSQSISPNTEYYWDFGDGTTSTLEFPNHTYTTSGTYLITLIVQDIGSCNFADTTMRRLVVLANSNRVLDTLGICSGDFVQIGIPPAGDNQVTYQWTPSTGLSNPNISNPIASPTITTQYTLYLSNQICVDTLSQRIEVENLLVNAGNNDTICTGDSYQLNPTYSVSASRFYWSLSPDFAHCINSNFSQPRFTVFPTQTTTYYLKVTGLYCESIDSVTITVIPYSVTAPASYTICYGDTVQISVQVSPPGFHTYNWSPTQTIIGSHQVAAPFVNPTTNTVYTATVVNQFGCIATATVTVILKQLEAEVTTTNVTCYQGNDGHISVVPTGGVDPYFFAWSNGGNTAQIGYLTADTYSVLVTDALGCKMLATFTIQEPPPINVNLVSATPVVCDQICNGNLTVAATGGTGAISYYWLHNQQGALADSLCAGLYTVIVADEHQCTATASFQVPDTSDNTININVISPLCFGDCTGEVALTLDFNMPYSILWNTGDTLPQLDSLCTGQYHAFINETSGCVYNIYAHVPELPPLQFTNIYTLLPSCNGDADGSIRINTTGGTAPYSYFINEVPCGNEIQNLSSGTYLLTVIDANDCRVDTNLVLTEPNPIIVTEQHQQPPCPQVCNGTISLNVTGGTPPYRYDWSNGNTLSYGESLCIGTYTIEVNDVMGCRTSIIVTLSDSSLFPVPIQAWSDEDTIYEGASTVIHATDLDGFIYQWQPPTGLATPTQPNSVATPPNTITYVILVRDMYGCEKRDTLRIHIKEVICDEPYIFIPNAFSPNGDGINDMLFVRGDFITECLLRIYDRWGEKVFETTSTDKGWDGTFKEKDCQQGVYDYYLEVWCLGEKQFFKKGNVTLLR